MMQILNHISHQRKSCQSYSRSDAIRWHEAFESDMIKYQQCSGDFSIYYPHLAHLSSPARQVGRISLTDFRSALLWAAHATSGPEAQPLIRETMPCVFPICTVKCCFWCQRGSLSIN